MADNLAVTPGTGANVASDELTYSGDTVKVGIGRLVHVTGTEGSKTLVELIRLEDAAHTSGDPGMPMLGVRQDTAASLAGTDGDYTLPIFNATGHLWTQEKNSAAIQTAVEIIDNFISGSRGLVTEDNSAAIKTAVEIIDNFISGSRGLVTEDNSAAIKTAVELIDDAIFTDDAAFTPATSKGLAVGLQFDDVATDSVDEGDFGVPRMSANRNVYTQIRDAAGNERGANVNASNQLLVTGPVTNAGTFAVQVDGNALTALQLIDDTVFADDAAFTVATSKVSAVGYMADEASTDSVNEDDIGIARMTLDRKQIVSAYAHTAGGATPYKLISAASTNATSVKASAGQVYLITASNVNASARYLKLYNKASAPTVGTDTPVFTFIIPGNTAGAGTNIAVPATGIEFTTGIAFALTTGIADSDTGAVAANDIAVNLAYK